MNNFRSGGGFGGGRGNNGFRGGFSGGSRGGYDSRPREMYKAICDECGRDCEVPFRPSGSKPVLCSNCFELKNGPRQDRSERSGRPDDNTRVRRFERDGRPIETREEKENRNLVQLKEEVARLGAKLDKVLEMLEAPKKKVSKKSI